MIRNLTVAVTAAMFFVAAGSDKAAGSDNVNAIILLQEDFSGAATTNLNGIVPLDGDGNPFANAFRAETGGQYNADGSIDLGPNPGANSLASIAIGSVINDAAGTPNGLFELSASINGPFGDTGTFISLGFSQLINPALPNNFIPVQGIGTLVYRPRNGGEIDTFSGNGFTPNGATPAGNSNFVTTGNTSQGLTGVDLTVQIDLRDANGVDDFGTVNYFNGNDLIGSFNYTNDPTPLTGTNENNDNGNGPGFSATPTEPEFDSIIISGNRDTTGTISNLVLTQFIEVEVGLPGDSNDDGVVDSADYTVLRDLFGQSVTLPGEDPAAVTPGVVDQEDFDFFVSQFGASSGTASTAAAATAVPEPGALLLLFAGVASALSLRNRR